MNKIVIIGAGQGGSLLLPLFQQGDNIEIIGIADINKDAQGLRIAERYKIPIYQDPLELIKRQDVNVIVDVTGNPNVTEMIIKNKAPYAEVIGGAGANLFWNLVNNERKRYQTIYDMGTKLSSTNTIKESLETIIEKATEVTNTPAGSIALYDKKNNDFYLATYKGFSGKFLSMKRWQLRDHGLTKRIFDNKNKPLAISDVNKDRKFDNPIMIEEGIRSLIAAPLIVGNAEIVGILYVDDFKPRNFTDGEISFLGLLAAKATFAIQKIQLLEKLTNLVETSPDAVISTNEHNNIDIFNSSAEDMLGYKKDEIQGSSVKLLYENEERAKVIGKQLRNNKGILKNFETELRTKNGNLIPVMISVSWLRDQKDGIIGTIGVSKDLRGKKELEHQQIKLIERLKAVHDINISISRTYDLEIVLDIIIDDSLKLMNAIEGSILLVDRKEKVLKAFSARGRRKEEIPDLPIQESGSIAGWVAYTNKPYLCGNVQQDTLYYAVSDKTVSEIAVPLIYEGEVIGVLDIESENENAFSEADKEILNLIASQAAIAIKKAEFIKDKDEMHESLVHASRLISVGEIAATVAHELGNSLNTIGMGIRNLKNNIENDKKLRENEKVDIIINDIDGQMVRLGEIVSRLTDYSRKAKEEKNEDIDINDIVKQSLRLLKPQLDKKQANCKSVLEPKLPLVVGNKVQIFEAYTNIFLNALWAISRKGNLDIRTSYDQNKKTVVIRIADDGIGIIQQHLSNIFDPFFTTKPRGEGTGLGLYVSKKIVDIHKGSIEVESKRGKGTTFYIYLPAKEEI